MQKRILALFSFVILIVMLMGTSTPVLAWKVKAHVYSANLLYEEIQRNQGYIEIKPFGKFKIRPDYHAAIINYPDFFRAGAMGPDTLPDIYVGQTQIHPGRELFGSGEYIETLWEKAQKLPEKCETGGLSGDKLEMANKMQVMAFVLGCSVHAAGDFFGHSYINQWAKGAWPEISEQMSEDDVKIIIRHNVVEAFIDKQIPAKYKTSAYNRIKVPQQFLYETLVSNGEPTNYDNVMKDSRAISFYINFNKPSTAPKHLRAFYDLREKLRLRIASIYSAGTAEKKLRYPEQRYLEEWMKDIDRGLAEWVAVNAKVSQHLLEEEPPEGSTADTPLDKINEEYMEWASGPLVKMLGAPDVAADITSKIYDINKVIADMLDTLIKPITDQIKNNVYDYILTKAMHMTYRQLKDIVRNPETYLDDPKLFEPGTKDKIRAELENFYTAETSGTQEFVPFQNTLVLAKVNLIGIEGVRELRTRANVDQVGYPLTERKYGYIEKNMFTSFVRSFDFGYDWNNPEMIRFLLWNHAEDQIKVARVIFNLEGTQRPIKLLNVPKGTLTYSPTGYREPIVVRYENGRNKYVIGLFKADNPHFQLDARTNVMGASGEYTVSAPDEEGAYQIRVYGDYALQKILIAASDPFEVKIPNKNLTYFYGVSQSPVSHSRNNLAPKGNLYNPLSQTGFVGLYPSNEPNPDKFIDKVLVEQDQKYLNFRTMPNSAAALIKSGTYEYRFYNQNKVLIVKSEPFQVINKRGLPRPRRQQH